MLGFVERTVRLLRHVAQMGEVDVGRESFAIVDEVVLAAGAIGTGAERQAVGRRAARPRSAPRASSARETTRGRPKIGNGGSSGWIAIRTPTSSAIGTISRRKANRFSRKPSSAMSSIDVERAAEALAVEDEFARRHPADQVVLQPRQIALAHRREPPSRRLDALGRMIGLGALALQHQHVIGAEIDDVEAQRRAAMRHRIVEVGARPVGDRHEIVADRLDAGGGERRGSRPCSCRSARGSGRCVS